MRTHGPIVAALSFAVLLVGAAACGPDGGDDDPSACGANLVPGDLVITEVMANPTGEDDGNEWFEIYNASSTSLDLTGVALGYEKLDGTGVKSHAMGQLVVEAGDYVVVGDVLAELKPAYVDYGYGNDLGSMTNTGGVLTIGCEGTEIDRVEYPEAPGADGGVTSILDGNIVPDHLANDDVANFCASTTAFDGAAGIIGSPGEANELCNVVVPGTCDDGGTDRPVVSPEVGDLVISEFMANPSGADGGKEWFEVYVARTVDLNGVVAGLVPGSPKVQIDDPTCVTAAAGSYVLFAASDDAALNGGLPQVDRVFTFTMKNGTTSTGDGTLFVGLGDTLLDAISYTASSEGASTALKPDQLDATANDDPANYVTCEASYGAAGELGTPRAANDTCTTPEGQCDDGGSFRAIVPPAAGDLIVTEAMANPAGATEGPQEWFEVEVTADVDLNGLEIGKISDPYTVAETINAVECVRVTAGTRIVFAHDPDAADNDGLPEGTRLFATTLTNSNSEVFVGHAGALLSRLRWTTTRNGRARALQPDGSQVCDAEATYGTSGTNFGSPGAANPTSTTQCVAP